MSPIALPTTPSSEELAALVNSLPEAQREQWRNLARMDDLPGDLPADTFWHSREMAVRAKLLHSETRKRVDQAWAGNAERVIAGALSIVDRKSDPAWHRLLSCQLETLSDAVCQCARLRLVPSMETGEAFLVPVKNAKTGLWSVAGVPGTQGILASMNRAGKLHTAQAFVVYSQDGYDYAEGGDRDPEIRRPKGGYDNSVPNVPIWAVARVVTPDGRKHIEARPVSGADRARFALNMRMPLEAAVKNAAMRPALRAVITTYYQDEENLVGLLRAESDLWKNSTAVDPSYRLLLDGPAAVEQPATYKVMHGPERAEAASQKPAQAGSPAAPAPVAAAQPTTVETPQMRAARERLASAHARVVAESVPQATAPTAAAPQPAAPSTSNTPAPARDAVGRGIKR